MLKKVIIVSTIFVILLVPAIFWMDYLNVYLFISSPWLLFIPAFLGLLFGVLKTGLKSTSGQGEELAGRHTVGSFMEHWGAAFGIIILMVSGFVLKASASLLQTNLHFLGLFVTLLFGSYFLIDFFAGSKFNTLLPDFTDIIDGTVKKYLLRSKWKDGTKYSSSQKSSFLAFLTLGIGIMVTGIVKVIGLSGNISPGLLQVSTTVHDAAAELFSVLVLLHIILALAVPSNLRLSGSWFTGKTPEKPGQAGPPGSDRPGLRPR
jgi:cytochrome b subunit of formate dehydrogenase